MEEIEVVIKIPQEEYETIVNSEDCGLHTLTRAIARGTILPKGHGRIGDLDALRCENTDFDTYNDYCTMFDEIDAAETILEADEGGAKNEQMRYRCKY